MPYSFVRIAGSDFYFTRSDTGYSGIAGDVKAARHGDKSMSKYPIPPETVADAVIIFTIIGILVCLFFVVVGVWWLAMP